ncbi:MAG: fibronectin type III domain-containing protein [Lewinellaceae bacterium]|nr:fibronectin type III domain-containing protein [Lewinellaceae bacterium]
MKKLLLSKMLFGVFCALLSTIASAKPSNAPVFPASLETSCDLPAPENFHVESFTYSTADLSWDAVQDAQAYDIIVEEENGSMHSHIQTTDLFATVANLDVHKRYVAHIASICNIGLGEKSPNYASTDIIILIVELVVQASADYVPTQPAIPCDNLLWDEVTDRYWISIIEESTGKIARFSIQSFEGILNCTAVNYATVHSITPSSTLPLKLTDDSDQPAPICANAFKIRDIYTHDVLFGVLVKVNGQNNTINICDIPVNSSGYAFRLYVDDPGVINGNGRGDIQDGNPESVNIDEKTIHFAIANPVSESLQISASVQ